MSTIEHPSEQVQVFINANKDYAAGDFEAFGDRFTSDFRRDNLPSTLNFGPNMKLGDSTKEEFLKKMIGSRTAIFKEDFKINITDLVEQPGRFVIFGVQESSTTLELREYKSDLVMLVDVRRDTDGKLRIKYIKEFLDSVSMAEFIAAVAKKFAGRAGT